MRTVRTEPGPGQESVWDYPRPPRIEDFVGHIRVIFNDIVIADTHEAKRVLETSHPPVYYISPRYIQMQYLIKSSFASWCEFKGNAKYYTVSVNEREAENAGWYYPQPVPDFLSLKDHVAFYSALMDACFVNDERVKAQEGDFYGGWITSNIVGPIKGEAGTRGW